MKHFLIFIFALCLFPTAAFATAVSWDYTGTILRPLQSMWSKEVRVPYITATSTATSTLPALSSTSFRLGSDRFTDLTGTGLVISSNALQASLGTSITVGELASADFGDWTCNGSTCALDATYLTGNQTITLSGDASGSGATSIVVAVSDDSHAHTGSTISGIDVSSDLNLTAGDALTLTGDNIDFDGGNAPGGELGGTWGSPTIDDSLAVTSWNLTTPTLTSFFGTPCAGNQFLQDIGDTGTFSCATVAGGGGAGLATSTAIADTYIIYGTSAGTVGAEAAFTYDDATNKLVYGYGSTTALTATTLYGALVGNAQTATALAANGSNCSAGSYPLGVDASGAVETCTADAIVTAGDALTLTGTDIDFDGGATPSGDLGGTWGTPSVTDNSHAHDATTISGLGTADISGIDIGDDTNLAAGRSLTLSGDSVEADAELYTHSDCKYIEDPVAADDLKSLWANKTANDWTITEIWGESDQTVSFDLQVDDGSPADVNGSDIAPAAGEAEDTSLSGDTTLAAGEELDLDITSVTNTPTWVSICLTWTVND